jgi:hypothetical protein
MGEKDLRGSVRGLPTLTKLLHEYFPKHNVVHVLEDSTEDYGHSVGLGLDVPIEETQTLEICLKQGWKKNRFL